MTLDPTQIPRHIAVIMDGNGRWAKQRGLDRSRGHVEGVNSVRNVTREASDLGVKFLTLYTFSTENWNRPKEEVDALMTLIGIAIERETPELIRNNVRLTIIGDMSRVPYEALSRLNKCVDATANSTGLNLILAISYSSRWELTRAAKLLAQEVADGKIRPEDIDEEAFASRLTTAGIPDPDLLIRTGGDLRVSNYLLWQIAYSEIFVTPVFWPDFGVPQLHEAIAAFQARERRFGLTSEQVSKQ